MSDSDSEDSVYGFNRKPRETFQENSVKCTYEWCEKLFGSKERMQYHKKNEPDHFYCKKCDIDCEDWEALVAHKVEKMAPFIEGKKSVKEELPEHIVCEFCGEDFKSLGGRKRHREITHPAEQVIKCPGCPLIFARAAHMIGHLEDGRCPHITRQQFLNCINHKWIIKQVMQDHVYFQNAISAAQQRVPEMDHLQEITDGFETHDKEDGGVSLLDQRDEAQIGGYKSLEPEVDLLSSYAPPKEDPTTESWPRLAQSMKSMSVASDVTSRRGGHKVVTDDGTSSDATMTAWAKGNASNALFKHAKPTPTAGDWDAILEKRHAETSKNLLTAQFWNPASKDYDVNCFWNPVLECYRCPFPACDIDNLSFDHPSDVQAHLEHVHFLSMYRCLNCFKRFEKPSGLIGHVESTRKCAIKHHSKFEQFVHEITGGFLQAEPVGHKQPQIYRPDMSLVLAGDTSTFGVKQIEFKSTLPI